MLQAADKKRVTKVINDLGRRVTVADVSARSGLPVLVVSQALNQIASETSGRLAVSQNGDLVYSFALGFANTYLAQGLKKFVEKNCEQVIRVAYFLLRISFGITLMVSLVIVLFLFFLLLFSNKGRSDRKKTGDAQPAKVDLVNAVMLREAFQALTSKPRQPVRYDYNVPSVRPRERPNFLLDCFSLLFGDGDPNAGLSEKRWQLIAEVIKQHDNVITSEQLSPYTGAAPGDEDAVLPVLVRFNGKPEVTESGNIIYTFPALAVTTGCGHPGPPPAFLTEFPCNFTEVDENALTPIYMVAALNFVGSWFFWFLLASKNAPSITALLTALVTYGTLFLAVPFLRYMYLGTVNRRIERRNDERAARAEALLTPGSDLRKKIAESREYRLRDQRIGTGNIVYTTEKSNLEQQALPELPLKPGDKIDAKPETFDASPKD